MKRLIYLLPLLIFLTSCAEQEREKETASPAPVKKVALSDSFNNYWYNGEAEISTYQLEQVRYGDIHRGHASFIFVTEPFSKSKHVKLDNPSAMPEDKVNVMKLNFTRKFNTGIYPYSLMLSNFRPIENAADQHSLKTTFSAQEWCGQSFFQLNKESSKDYSYHGFSYFESVGDQMGSLENIIPEDELWSTIRIQPDLLPTGDVQLFPCLAHIRLRHVPIKAYSAKAQLKKIENGKMVYTLDYEEIDRYLSITFDEKFPHTIHSWEEEIMSGFGKNAQSMTTKAVLMKQIRSKYWQQNHPNDRSIRKQLNLPENYQ
jgi:hypothetical protein